MLAAVRVRGKPDTPQKARDVMKRMLLHTKHSCVIMPDTDTNRGMLQQAKDYIAYGEISEETAAELLRKRGTVAGNAIEDAVDEVGYDSIDAVVDAIENGDISLGKLRSNGLTVPFRLSPPSKGFKGTRTHYRQGGSLGERDDMDALLRRMI